MARQFGATGGDRRSEACLHARRDPGGRTRLLCRAGGGRDGGGGDAGRRAGEGHVLPAFPGPCGAGGGAWRGADRGPGRASGACPFGRRPSADPHGHGRQCWRDLAAAPAQARLAVRAVVTIPDVGQAVQARLRQDLADAQSAGLLAIGSCDLAARIVVALVEQAARDFGDGRIDATAVPTSCAPSCARWDARRTTRPGVPTRRPAMPLPSHNRQPRMAAQHLRRRNGYQTRARRTGRRPVLGRGRAHGSRALPTRFPTTAALIAGGEAEWRAAAARGPDLRMADVTLLSPVTAPCRVICQGANYRQHMVESGLNPDEKAFNMFFEKSDASVAPPVGEVVRPSHVRLLDYEVELGLVMGAAVTAGRPVTPEDLPGLIFGLVIANDISARDVQLPQMQFFKGKSYRGFCPVGPYLTIPDRAEFALIDDLLTLSVNGEVRQLDSTRNLVFGPAETLAELTTFSDLSPGDLILTGTPAGCALRVPRPPVRRLMQLLPERVLWKAFVKAQQKRPAYLHPGDRMTLTIRAPMGASISGSSKRSCAA